MFNGLHYAILYYFWDQLINLGPVAVSVFSLFLSYIEKEYQTESKRNKTFAMIFLDQKTPSRLGEEVRGVPRRPQARGMP